MECRAKIVLLGACGCGKSSILKNFLTGSFDPNHSTTVGAAYQTKTFYRDGDKVCMDIWDTAGQERYSAIAPMYYRDAQVIIVVYDLVDSESVNIAKKWCAEIRIQNKDALLVVFGNKTDLILKGVAFNSPHFAKSFSNSSMEETLRNISGIANTQFKEYNSVHLCGSAKTGEGIDFLFKTVCNRTKYIRHISPISSSWCCL